MESMKDFDLFLCFPMSQGCNKVLWAIVHGFMYICKALVPIVHL